eukprot:UC4_evm1s994
MKIPDLYMGSSVVVAGKFTGPFPYPGNIVVSGKIPGYPQGYSLTITPEKNPYMPLSRLFVKTMMDDLTAQSWLQDSDELREKAIHISVIENMP